MARSVPSFTSELDKFSDRAGAKFLPGTTTTIVGIHDRGSTRTSIAALKKAS